MGMPRRGQVASRSIRASACAITTGSWVATTTVAPCSRAASASSLPTTAAFTWSRRDVGSSTSTSAGRPRQRAGDRDPLALAGREPLDPLVETVLEPKPHEPFARIALAPAHRQRELDVLDRRQVSDEPRILAHETDMPPPERRQLGRIEPGDHLARHGHKSRVGPHEPGEHAKERALPGARPPRHHGHAPCRELRRAAVEHRPLAPATPEADDHLAELGRDARGRGGRAGGAIRRHDPLARLSRGHEEHAAVVRLCTGQSADAGVAQELLGEAQPAASPDHDGGLACAGGLVAQPPVADVDGAVGDPRRSRVVAHQDDGRGLLPGQLADRVRRPFAPPRRRARRPARRPGAARGGGPPPRRWRCAGPRLPRAPTDGPWRPRRARPARAARPTAGRNRHGSRPAWPSGASRCSRSRGRAEAPAGSAGRRRPSGGP